MAESRMDIGFQWFCRVRQFGIMFEWPNQRSKSGDCGTRTLTDDTVASTAAVSRIVDYAECDDAVTGADAGDRAAQSAVKARVEPTQLARPPAVVTGAPGAGTGEIRQAA